MLKFSEEETVFLAEMEYKVHEDFQDHVVKKGHLDLSLEGPLTLDGETVLVLTLLGQKKSILE